MRRIVCTTSWIAAWPNSADIGAFLSCYFPDVFWGDWTDHRKEMVATILNAARYSGDQAIAAPRGEGKTSVVPCATMCCVLHGIPSFPLCDNSPGLHGTPSFCKAHVNLQPIRSRSTTARHLIHRSWRGLKKNGAKLANGRNVYNRNDAVVCMIEQLEEQA